MTNAISPVQQFENNAEEVFRLVEIHEELTGTNRGRRQGVEVLNKSMHVLLIACWQHFVEDTVSQAASALTSSRARPKNMPEYVQGQISRKVRLEKHELFPWRLTASGWKSVYSEYCQSEPLINHHQAGRALDPESF